MKQQVDQVSLLMEYEEGSLGANSTLDLFASLAKSGMAWSLQGHYGRTAQALIDDGWISKEGKVVKYPE